MRSFIDKINSHPLAKYFRPLALVLLIYIAYKVYLWSITQTTDNAYVEADISYVGAEVEGQVKNLVIKDNTLVKKNDIIAELDDESYRAKQSKTNAEVASSEAAIMITEQKILLEQITYNKAKSSLELAKINYEVAKDDYKRTEELSRENFSSKKILDASKVAFEKAKNEYTQAQLALSASEHNLELLTAQKIADGARLKVNEQEKILADRNLSKTRLLSPIDGIVTNNSVKVGNYIRPGSLIFAVVPVHSFYIKANFKETQIKKFKPGMKVEITFDAAPGVKVTGSIRNISPATGSKFSLLPPDNATGNFTKIVQRVPVLIDFDVPESVIIVPGMSAIVSVRT